MQTTVATRAVTFFPSIDLRDVGSFVHAVAERVSRRSDPEAVASDCAGAQAAGTKEGSRVLSRHRVEIKFGLLAALMLGLLFALDRIEAFAGLDSWVESFTGMLADVGFAGIFIISVVANASLLVHIPYTVPIISLALSGASLSSMLWAGLWAGLGCGLGEVISYFLARKVLGSNESLATSSLFRRVQQGIGAHPRLIPFVVFFCAVSPLPDDAVIIPLAMARYPVRLMLVPLFAGKIIHTVVVSCLIYEFLAAWSHEATSGGVRVDLALGLLIVFVLGIFYQIEKSRVTGADARKSALPC